MLKMKRRETGNLGEKLAQVYLEQRGYTVVETNYRCPSGEIDIIAKIDGYLVFVEVRSKRSAEYGSAEESITPSKKAHLIDSAAYYYQTHEDLPDLYRIDFVGVEIGRDNMPLRINLIENAITES